MRIASWNVNSLKVRLPHLQMWLDSAQPDIVGLQELKLTDDAFPHAALSELGYHAVCNGQKTYNGVALISREAPTEVVRDIPGLEDEQKRAIAASYGDLRVIDLYVVNGQAVGSDKYAYKLRWLEALRSWLADEIRRYPKLIVMGDFNIAPDDRDVHDPDAWRDQVLCSEPERAALAALCSLGLHDSYRLLHEEGGQFSWWDYRQAAFRRNRGLRIDLVLVSDALRSTVVEAGVDVEPRRLERPSDHAPAWVRLG